MSDFGAGKRQRQNSDERHPPYALRRTVANRKRDWKIPGAIIIASGMISVAVYTALAPQVHEIHLSEHDIIRIDTATGESQACTIQRQAEQCITISGEDGRLMPYIRDELRELGVRELVRRKLR